MHRRRPDICATRVRVAGFTIIELIVAVTIIGILTAMAIPSYRQYVIRGNRTAAKSAMMDLAGREQQYLLANRAYADTAALTANGYVPATEATDRYTWAVTVNNAASPPRFLITFTPFGGQAVDGALTLDHIGNKLPAAKWAK